MNQLEELRQIMDELVELEESVESLLLILQICEIHCESQSNEDGFAIVNVTSKQMKLVNADLKKGISKLDLYIIQNRKQSQI